jgi:hypothetical protein
VDCLQSSLVNLQCSLVNLQCSLVDCMRHAPCAIPYCHGKCRFADGLKYVCDADWL